MNVENLEIKRRTLGTTRIFNAAIEDVWKLWSELVHLDQWWGPRGFTQTTHKHEFVENGLWSFVMHGPNGIDYQNEMQYGEIIPHKKIVLRHLSKPNFTITTTFRALEPKRTEVVFSSLFDDQKTVDAVADFAILGNVEHQMRFEIELSKLTGEICPNEFVLSREFLANPKSLWEMFTDPKKMASWYGPKEVNIGQCEMDFRRGGSYHFSMIAGENESWGKVYYVDIVEDTRLIYVSTFSNAKGEITRHPMAPLMPAELLTTISFIKVNDAKSIVEIRRLPINAAPEEIKLFNSFHESFKMGWTGSLDRLEALL